MHSSSSVSRTSAHSTSVSRAFVVPAEAPYWVLRVGAALCFIGHGAFGFITKAAWLPYFAVVGIPESWAWRMMPVIGAVDVTVGMAVLFAPRRLPLGYMAVWAFWTALLRPLSGESVFEAVERAGNYGVPLALLFLGGVSLGIRSWFARVDAQLVPVRQESTFQRLLQATTVLLLLGHGALGAITGKAMFATHYAAAGLPAGLTAGIGWFEIGLAVMVTARPAVPLLIFVGAWKLATESLFVVAGAPIWEFVERSGSYAAPLALALAILASRGRAPSRSP